VPRIADFCSCIYVLGGKLSLVRLCDSDFGITAVYDIAIGITCAAFCFHMAHNSYYIYYIVLLLLLVSLLDITGIRVLSRGFRNSSLFTAACKTSPSPRRVSAASLLCQDVDITSKPTAS